jgi:hypothetical protein
MLLIEILGIEQTLIFLVKVTAITKRNFDKQYRHANFFESVNKAHKFWMQPKYESLLSIEPVIGFFLFSFVQSLDFKMWFSVVEFSS